ncbi:MAG: hypothetical protein WEB19_03980 [Acidimicrobiia bacterium]
MNFVGHIATGLAIDDASGTTFLLGTALPDFAAMVRLRLDRTDGELGLGMQLHHDTDAVFHRQGWFLEHEHELLADLVASGVPRGGALACAHVGVELLPDGEQLREPAAATAVVDVYAAMEHPPEIAIEVVPPDARDRWREHLSGIARRLDPFLYRDPSSVAQRLHRITSSRPRLAFDIGHVPTITEHLARVQPRIGQSAAEVLAEVARALE